MKRIALIIAMALFMFAGKSISQGTTLIVFSAEGEKFILEVNNSMQNSEPQSKVEVNNLFGPSIKTVLHPDDPGETEIKKNIFNTPAGILYYVYQKDARGRYTLAKTSHDWSGEVKGSTSSDDPPPAEERETPDYNNGSGCQDPLTDAEFEVSSRTVSRQPFDGPKLLAAKNLLKSHCLTSSQVARLINDFKSDGSQLDLAKYAYTRVYDPQEYDVVRDELDPASMELLDQYILSLDR